MEVEQVLDDPKPVEVSPEPPEQVKEEVFSRLYDGNPRARIMRLNLTTDDILLLIYERLGEIGNLLLEVRDESE